MAGVELLVQGGLVGLHDQHVGGVLVGDQPVGMLALGVHRVGSHHGGGQVQAVQQRPEPGDLVGLGSTSVWARTARLVWSMTASRCTCGPPWWPLPRRVLPSTATARRGERAAGGGFAGGGGGRAASQAPMARSRASASMRASTRRTVASPGGRQAPVRGSRRTPSAASTWQGASLAHSPIAARELAPATTAATATASTAPSVCRRPRRCRGSGSGRGSRAGHGTARVPARRARPAGG